MRSVYTFLFMLYSSFALYAQQTTSMSITPQTFQSMLRLETGEEIRFFIPLPQIGTRVAVLTRFRVTDVRTTFQLITENGLVDVPLPQSVHLKGAIEGYPNSTVILSVFDGWAVGRVDLTPGEQSAFTVCPQSSELYKPLIIAPESTLLRPAPWICATDDTEIKDSPSGKGESTQAVTLHSVKLALEGDQNYYQDHGNNAVTAAQYAEAVIAHSSSIYQRDVAATLYIGSLLIWTTADPYTGTNSSTLLTQFQNYWRTNRTNVDRDLAQLLSGINDIGGIANLDGICSNNNGYSVAGMNNNLVYPRTTYAWDTDVTSHEIGHNIGSPHTHSCTWNPPIDSCYFAEGSCFSTRKAVLGTIMSYCHLTTSGTELKFHSRVSALLKQRLTNANCVNVSTSMTLNAGNDTTICNGSVVTFNATYSDGTAPVTISWTPSVGMTGANSLSPVITPSATTSYILEIRDAYNAVVRDTVVVTVKPKLSVDIPTSASFCRGSILTVNVTVASGTQPITYRWKGWRIDTVTYTPSLSLIPETSTRLYLNATDANGCTGKDSLDITVFDQVDIALTEVDTIACNGSNIRLVCTVFKGSPPYVFTWFGNGTMLSTQGSTLTTTIDTATLYRVIVRDINNCLDTAQTFIGLTNQRFTATPKAVEIPDLPACKNEFEMWITTKNTGKDPIVITNVKGGKIIASSRDLPFTLQPGASHQMPVLCKLPAGDVLDTVRVISAQCGRVESVIVTGVRARLGVEPETNLSLAVPVLYCSGPQLRVVSVDVVNETIYDAQISSVSSRWFKTNAASFGPKTIRRMSSASIDIELNVAAPPGAVLDTLDIHYRSLGCEWSFPAPIRIETGVANLSMPNLINFGVVSSDRNELVSQDVSITPDISPLSSTTITQVSVTGPFTSSFVVPTLLQHNVKHTERVFFDPKSISQAGVVRGEISFVLDSCDVPYKIALVATQTVVGVTDDSEQDDRRRLITRNAIGTLLIRGTEGRLVVSDMRGVAYYSANVADGETIDLSTVPNGVYACALTQADGTMLHLLLLLP